jgi:hypothetical protein
MCHNDICIFLFFFYFKKFFIFLIFRIFYFKVASSLSINRKLSKQKRIYFYDFFGEKKEGNYLELVEL